MNRFIIFIVFFAFSSIQAQENQLAIDSLNYKKDFKRLLDSSNTLYNNGEYSKSIRLNMSILKLSIEKGDPYYIHQSYRYLAYDYLYLKDTILAMDSFKKSENYAKLSKNDTATAVTYMDLANVYSTYQDFNKALIYHDRSIRLFTKIKDSAGMAKANFNAAITAIESENYDRAFDYIQKSKELNEYGDDESFSINLDYFLGEYYFKKEEYEKSDSIILIAIKSAEKRNLVSELGYCYNTYSQSLFEQKKYKKAFEAQKKYLEYYDIAMEEEYSTERSNLSQKYQLEEYRKDIETARLNTKLQSELLKNKNTLNTILIIVSAIFLLLLIALYSASLKRKTLVKELRDKNEETLKAKENIEKLSKARAKFFSTVSHELRTPLYGVIGISSVLLEDKSLANHKKDLSLLKFSADYLLALINDVLQINKIDSKSSEDDQTSFNLKELIESITASFEYMRIQNNNSIVLEISEKIPKLLQGHSVRLSQILINLIGNACKFTEDGSILISAKLESLNYNEATIKFSIDDTGIGIAKDKQESVFDEFSQIDSKNYDYQGTGLGLPIVKKLLLLSDSDIELKSEPGKGSSFAFLLKFDIPEQKVKAEKTSIPLNTSFLKGKKILVVEDNRINQVVTRKILEKNDLQCYIAENGNEAIKLVKTNDYDLVLMDINMPKKNGIEATKEIRKFNKTIPIIALTAVEIEEMRNKIYDSGMDDIIVKPYDVTKFIAVIFKNISQAK